METPQQPYSFEGRNERQINIDDIIAKLLQQSAFSDSFALTAEQVEGLCFESRKKFLAEPMLLELNPPINICGDFHGQYNDLKEVFKAIGEPGQNQNYLLLGDYVDRGRNSLQCICLLLAYKVKFYGSVFMLRGNHECSELNRQYGFYEQCKRRATVKMWKSFCDVFNCLPIAAVVGGRIFCVHGGLSPSLKSLKQINAILRPTHVIRGKNIMFDLLWSDPSHLKGWIPNSRRGVSFTYGPDVIKHFLEKNDFDLICRSHQVMEDGYEFSGDKRLVTIFSAPNYCNTLVNKGAVLLVGQNMECRIQTFEKTCPQNNLVSRRRRMSTPDVKEQQQRHTSADKVKPGSKQVVKKYHRRSVASVPKQSKFKQMQTQDHE